MWFQITVGTWEQICYKTTSQEKYLRNMRTLHVHNKSRHEKWHTDEVVSKPSHLGRTRKLWKTMITVATQCIYGNFDQQTQLVMYFCRIQVSPFRLKMKDIVIIQLPLKGLYNDYSDCKLNVDFTCDSIFSDFHKVL